MTFSSMDGSRIALAPILVTQQAGSEERLPEQPGVTLVKPKRKLPLVPPSPRIDGGGSSLPLQMARRILVSAMDGLSAYSCK